LIVRPSYGWRKGEEEGVFMADEEKSTWVLVVCVIGIVGILVVIWALNQADLGSPPVRSRVARAKSEMRNLAVNLETYYIDQSAYPLADDENGNPVPLGASGEGISAGYVPRLLTTPIAYTMELPVDPYTASGRWAPRRTYRYATNGQACWILASLGPDQDPDIAVADYPSPATGNCAFSVFMSQFDGPAIEYDASNGTTSSGDIVRVGP